MNSERLQDAIKNMSGCIKYDDWIGIMDELEHYTFEERNMLTMLLYNGVTPMFHAATTNNVDLISYLVEECQAPVDQKCALYNIIFITPFWAAIWTKSYEAAYCLLQFGADINSKGWWGSTALMRCLAERDVKMADFLLANNANVNICSELGETPLMLAVFNLDITKELLKLSKHTLHLRDVNGNTALHYAVRNQNLNVTKLLIEEGLNPYTKNYDGKSAFDIAEENRSIHMAVALSCWEMAKEVNRTRKIPYPFPVELVLRNSFKPPFKSTNKKRSTIDMYLTENQCLQPSCGCKSVNRSGG